MGYQYALSLLLLLGGPALPRSLLEATTDAEPGDMTEMTTELVEEFLLEDGDEGLENTEVNCHKCLKESFKFRKELFCEKCLRKGLLDAAKVPQDNCKKCKKEKYFQKHSAYCEVKCQEYRAETEEESLEMTTVSTSTSSPDLGPLGNLFRLIIQANTWQ